MNSGSKGPDEILCPLCNRLPGASIKTGKAFVTHICHVNCGNIYWTLQQCPGCDHPQATVFVEKPRYSDLIKCKHCAKQFYLFLCPLPQCKGLFYKLKNSYLMGLPVNCQVCKHTYKEIVCQCGYQCIIDKNKIIFEGQSGYQCKMCKKPIIYTICTTCFKTNYHNESLQLGQKIKCLHCETNKQYVPCPKCGRTTKYDHFNYCKFYSCQYCHQSFEYSSCPFCMSPNFHFTSTPLGPVRNCSNKLCNEKYFVLSCNKCEGPVYFDDFDGCDGREEDCPQCKTQLKFYYCQACKTFNPKDSKCINPKCPPPKRIKSYTKQAKQAKQAKQKKHLAEQTQKLNENYQEKQCKLCFSEPSCMVNNNCRHLMMCQNCFKEYNKKAKRNPVMSNIYFAPCPVCKVIGMYTKVIQYIYQ